MKLNANDRASLRVLVNLIMKLGDREYEMSRHAKEEVVNIDYLSGKAQARLECAHQLREFFNLDMDEGKS